MVNYLKHFLTNNNMLIYPLPKLTLKEVKNVKAAVRENLKLCKAVNICFDEKKATIAFSDI